MQHVLYLFHLKFKLFFLIHLIYQQLLNYAISNHHIIISKLLIHLTFLDTFYFMLQFMRLIKLSSFNIQIIQIQERVMNYFHLLHPLTFKLNQLFTFQHQLLINQLKLLNLLFIVLLLQLNFFNYLLHPILMLIKLI